MTPADPTVGGSSLRPFWNARSVGPSHRSPRGRRQCKPRAWAESGVVETPRPVDAAEPCEGLSVDPSDPDSGCGDLLLRRWPGQASWVSPLAWVPCRLHALGGRLSQAPWFCVRAGLRAE